MQVLATPSEDGRDAFISGSAPPEHVGGEGGLALSPTNRSGGGKRSPEAVERDATGQSKKKRAKLNHLGGSDL
jgi:hypothetical protein